MHMAVTSQILFVRTAQIISLACIAGSSPPSKQPFQAIPMTLIFQTSDLHKCRVTNNRVL